MDASAAAERSVLLVNYENQRNAFKLVDIKSPTSAGLNDVVYASPGRHWLHAGPPPPPPSASPGGGRLVAPRSPPPRGLYPAADCVYAGGELRPCGCPRFLSASLPDVTSELQYAADDRDVDEPEVYSPSRAVDRSDREPRPREDGFSGFCRSGTLDRTTQPVTSELS